MKDTPFRFDAEAWAVLFRVLLGFSAIAWMHAHQPFAAGITLVLCVWVDAITGWIFRKLGAKSATTSALENYADFVCFVAAPMGFVAALVVHQTVLILLPMFLVAAVYRMVRFQIQGLVGSSYRGLPVTYNGYWFPLAAIGAHFAPAWYDFFFAGTLIATSALMVSRRLLIPEF